MPRPLRFIPEGGALVEITVRTFQSRLLLRPSPELNEVVGGVLGRAQRLSPVRCHAAVFLSNHFHLLLTVEDALTLSTFMEYLNSNLAREVNRLHGWRNHLWEQRYKAILVSEEEAAQVSRLSYLLAHGVKEGLVAHAREWPGVHSVRETLEGQPIRGTWFDRTTELEARRRGEAPEAHAFSSPETLELTPLPCWAHFSPGEYRKCVAELVRVIELQAEAELERLDRMPLGVAGVLRQDPQSRPQWTKRKPAPPFHAATQRVRVMLRSAYRAFVSAFRAAAEKLRAGDRAARFPLGSFPPGLPFVVAEATRPP
jgi:REP element-mobilizing transposase RayT